MNQYTIRLQHLNHMTRVVSSQINTKLMMNTLQVVKHLYFDLITKAGVSSSVYRIYVGIEFDLTVFRTR